MPSLDRLQHYVDVLDRERGRHPHMQAAELIAHFEDVQPRLAREDFRAMGIPLEGTIDLHAHYWEVRRVRGEAEREVFETTDVAAVVPDEEEIFTQLRKMRGAPATAEAARLAELAFDTAAENAALFFHGHGAMLANRIAHRHQIRTAKKIWDEMYGVAIVADEVGLGKTVVAGLLLHELLAHEPGANVLILVPPNLRKQWGEDELPKFFGLSLPWRHGKEGLSRAASDRILLFSLDEAKGNGKGDALSTALLQRKWDLVIVDEAHDCRNAIRIRFQFVYALHARRRIFLTATPLQNSGYDIFTLATLLKPGCLGPRSSFAERFMDGERQLKDSNALQRSLDPMMTRTLRRDAQDNFATRKYVPVPIEQFATEEGVLYDEILDLLQTIYRRHMGASAEVLRPSGRPQHVSQFVLIAMLVLREMASHPLAAIQTLQTALRAQVHELAGITRDDTDLARLDEFIARYTAQDRWDITHHAKCERLLLLADELLREGAKFIVFVNYLQTHEIVAQFLRERHRDVKVLSYEGSLAPHDKTRVLKDFNDHPRACLVSTDAAGQGLNLDTASCVINYDFPWNPMRVEQRIGRIDRAKDKPGEIIRIFNFRTLGTVEEYVQIVLLTKLKQIEKVLGEFTSPLEMEKVFEDKLTMGIGTALLESTSVEEMRWKMSHLGEKDLRKYVGEYTYEKEAPAEWTWRPRV